MSEDNKFAIIEGERKNLGKIIWMAIFLIAVTAFIVYGPKKSFDFVKNQLSFALTPEEKWGVTVFLKAEDFRGTREDLYKMSDEQLVVFLETDRYGAKDDDIAIMVLHRLLEKIHPYPWYLEKSLRGRLRKVVEDIIGIDRDVANLVPVRPKNLDEFFNSYLAGSKVALAVVMKYELDQI